MARERGCRHPRLPSARPAVVAVPRSRTRGESKRLGLRRVGREDCAARLVLLGQAEQKSVQVGSLVLVQRSEELVLELAGERAETAERSLPCRSEADEVPAAIVRIAATFHELTLFELVEQPHELPAVVTERIGNRPL